MGDEAKFKWLAFLSVAVPVHQEFFCRVIDSYPRTKDGLLKTINNDVAPILELFMLRTIGEFPIHTQYELPAIPFLHARFRANVELIAKTMAEIIPDEVDLINRTVACPAGENAPETDLSSIPIHRLWAAEVGRLMRMLEHNCHGMSTRQCHSELARLYNRRTLQWLNNGLSDFIGVAPLTGNTLVNAVVTCFRDIRRIQRDAVPRVCDT
ncbi:hypothetical protein VNI00_019197 [Paramarasmius palmivorus]|uniref:Uncharacterized protein n=1 Tax=Paramarasmius palmivorus TaxID=297713 RepID=A0AAW0AQB8_9AGAR